MPPTSPANTMVSMGMPISAWTGAPLLSWIERILLLTVSATSMERKAPTKLRMADRMTAAFGFRAPVAMDVAIALAVSWKPLVKSNAKAVTTTTTRMNNASVTPQACGPETPKSQPGWLPGG